MRKRIIDNIDFLQIVYRKIIPLYKYKPNTFLSRLLPQICQ